MSDRVTRSEVRRVIVVAYLWLMAIGGGAAPAWAQRQVKLPPSGRVSWAEIARQERLHQPPPEAPPEIGRAVHAPLPGPPVREIGHAAGAGQGERLLPGARAGEIPGAGAGAEAGGSGCGTGLPDLQLQENFQALADNNGSIPPDTHGAVGPSHVMTIHNTEVRIQTRDGMQLSKVSLSTFWTVGTGLSGGPFDPKVLYDPLAARWIAVCDANSRSTSSAVFLAMSDNADPTGMWTFWSMDADGTDVNWADYPGIGVNSVWIAITNNMFTVSSDSFSAVKMWVIDKASALAGGVLTITEFDVGFDLAGTYDSFTMQPAQTFDLLEPDLYIASSPGVTTGGIPMLRVSRITGTGPAPTWEVLPGSTFTDSGLFAVVNDFQTSLVNADQLGGSTLIETNDYRMLNSVYRNGRLWCTHSGGLPGSGTVDRTAVFWYEFNPAAGSPLVQSGVVEGGAGTHCFFPSISVNCADDMCVGFTRSDATRYAEAAYAGRLGSDAANTTRPVTVTKPGESFYSKFFSGSRNRWGDYSATVVDPTDDASFWTIQEYAATNVGTGTNDGRWGTWWARVGTSSACVGDVDGEGSVSVADLLSLLAAWGPCAAPCPADLDHDGSVTVADLLDLLAGWGPCPIPNDDMENVTVIGDGTYAFHNTGANTDGPSDCAGLEKDIWYCYLASCNGDAIISLCGSGFDTVLAVYDGCLDTSTLLACSDDVCGTQSEVAVPVSIGQQLLIRIGGKSGAEGSGTLTVSCPDPDFCATPDEIGLGDTPFSTLTASSDGPPLPPTCDEGLNGLYFAPDIWFLFTAPASGTYTISTCNQADYDTRLAAYTGECGSLNLIACNDDALGCGLTSEMTIDVLAGVAVRIRVGGFDTEVGTGTLTISSLTARGRGGEGRAKPGPPPIRRGDGGNSPFDKRPPADGD